MKQPYVKIKWILQSPFFIITKDLQFQCAFGRPNFALRVMCDIWMLKMWNDSIVDGGWKSIQFNDNYFIFRIRKYLFIKVSMIKSKFDAIYEQQWFVEWIEMKRAASKRFLNESNRKIKRVKPTIKGWIWI